MLKGGAQPNSKWMRYFLSRPSPICFSCLFESLKRGFALCCPYFWIYMLGSFLFRSGQVNAEPSESWFPCKNQSWHRRDNPLNGYQRVNRKCIHRKSLDPYRHHRKETSYVAILVASTDTYIYLFSYGGAREGFLVRHEGHRRTGQVAPLSLRSR